MCAFDATKPADGTDCADVDNEIRANFAGIQKGDHWTAAAEVAYKEQGCPWYDSANDVFKVYTGSEWKTIAYGQSGATLFGAWASKSTGTDYLAATDGIVTAYSANVTGAETVLTGLTDANATPTTTRCVSRVNVAAGASQQQSISMPVRKGDYYKVTVSGTTATMFWLPVGA